MKRRVVLLGILSLSLFNSCAMPPMADKRGGASDVHGNLHAQAPGFIAPGFLAMAVSPPPPNDNFDNATVVTTLPFHDMENTSGATTEPNEIVNNCLGVSPYSVWYRYTPTETRTIIAHTYGSNYGTVLGVYTATAGPCSEARQCWETSAGTIGTDSCVGDSAGVQQSRIRMEVQAGTTYYFQIVRSTAASTPNDLMFSIEDAPPPLQGTLTIDDVGTIDPVTKTVKIGYTSEFSQDCAYFVEIDADQKSEKVTGIGVWDQPRQAFAKAGVPEHHVLQIYVQSGKKFTPGPVHAFIAAFAGSISSDFDTGSDHPNYQLIPTP